MIKRPIRTIKEPTGNSRITLEQARAAAYHVYRDRLTGRYVMSKAALTPKQVREAAAKRRKIVRTATPAMPPMKR
ncbi:MAG TPA: hypothetical protein VGQ65_19900 [Thermoanaerobaculia bacterium]|jgi:hypothetical protein|nr:hypothetical protein [Thermoanaerobaculia bacterium]